MKVEVVGKNGFTPSDSNKDYAVKKLSKLKTLISDYDNISARVVCKVYKQFHKVEITIRSKDSLLRAEVSQPDIYAAMDAAVDKLVSQIKRHNDRVKDKLGKKSIRNMETGDNTVEPSGQKIAREKHLDLEPMTREEAIDQMESLGHDFFVYLDKETRRTNVIYIREDGDYAVIETEAK